MTTLQLEIEDSKLEIVLNIINSLKDDIIKKYEVKSDVKEQNDFITISQSSLEKIWDNKEDRTILMKNISKLPQFLKR